MDTITQENIRLREAVTECLTGHDLLGVLDHGASDDENALEAEDIALRIVDGEPITAELVATVCHRWFGDPSDEPQLTSSMEALAADLQNIQRDFGKK